jgi:dTDP-4-dehydrorhamnose 3,5-epimerase-like enzyme
MWNDPDLAIDWNIPVEDALVSEKDSRNKTFKEYLEKKK